MRRQFNAEVILTCAVTGDDRKVKDNPNCPVTPDEIAASALDAVRAGAAIVHIHVRDPETGDFSMETRHYRRVIEVIRESGVDCIVNFTCGMGGYIAIGDRGLENTPGADSDFVSQEDRMRHIIELCEEGRYVPEMCTIDCGTLNFGDVERAYVSTPGYVRRGAEICRELGVKPELEIFDTGNLTLVLAMAREGLIDAPLLAQLCTGINYGMPTDVALLCALVDQLPEDALWASFGLGRLQMPMVAQSVMLGGHVRVGLEDNLYLSRGVYATNAQLVEKARGIVEGMGARLLGPDEARARLRIERRGR